MDFKAFKLVFNSPLHLSRGKPDYDESDLVYHSDSLKSALAVCALQLGLITEVKPFLEGFRLSSAFPYFRPEKGEDVLFFPSFTGKINIPNEKEDLKKLKKIKFIGQSEYETVLKGGKAEVNKEHLNKSGFASDKLPNLSDKKACTHSWLDANELFKKDIQERVYIPHLTNQDNPTMPFYMERIYFRKGSGLFFFYEPTQNCQDKGKLERILGQSVKLLGQNGIGSDRNVGNGHFDDEGFTLSLNVPTKADSQTNLSLYCPASQNDLAASGNLSYNLVKRGGWVASPQVEAHGSLRKKSVYMFEEGGIFPFMEGRSGKLCDLTPADYPIGHPVYRDGTAIFLPFNFTKDER